MASKAKKYGTFEYGDVYEYDKVTGNRGLNTLGKLIVDQDNERFYIKSEGQSARNISYDRVNWMLYHNLIEFYQDDSRTLLIDYMMRIEENKQADQAARRKLYGEQKATTVLKTGTKLIKRTRRNALLARVFWTVGCVAIVALGCIAAIPTPEPAPAERSIAGVGMMYPVDSAILKDATYMTAFGNGSDLYGIVLDNTIIESGQQNANETAIKENVLINSSVSESYPIHMRPLYYDRSAFYQSELVLNDANGGSSGVLLQNPNGYSLSKPANEIVLFGGRGMGSTVISSPNDFNAKTASETANEIEKAQEEALRKALGSDGSSQQKDEYLAASMPEAWNGYDSVDVDGNLLVASYWYTKDASLKKEDLKRRIVVYNIKSVFDKGKAGLNEMEAMQLNYQDLDSNFYDPVCSESPSSNGSAQWIGYMKESIDGSTGFFIRKYETAEDVIAESYGNTLSTRDLTGNNFPITNYQLNGDKLFFEQQGYIWVIDLSKTSIDYDDATKKRTIKKENPIQICKASEIRPSVSRDEQFLAKINGTTTVPVSHYQVMTLTTQNGKVIYGIAFIEADSGNLVFQPCNGATVAAAEQRGSEGGNTNSTDSVTSSDQAALEKSLREKANEEIASNQRSFNDKITAQEALENQLRENADQDTEGITVSRSDTVVDSSSSSGGATIPFSQSAYTLEQAAEEQEIDNGRILITAGSPDTQIVCFCVRGEQFYWLEESGSARRIMCSPVYYKNDASQLLSEAMEKVNDNGEIITNGLQPGEEDDAIKSTSSDIALDNYQGGGEFVGGEEQSPIESGEPIEEPVTEPPPE